MPARKVTPAMVERIAELREVRGWSFERIAQDIGLSRGAVQYRCLLEQIEPPRTPPKQSRMPRSFLRGRHPVRGFTPAEDAILLERRTTGSTISALARSLHRKPNSIRGRLLTLARRAARTEESANG